MNKLKRAGLFTFLNLVWCIKLLHLKNRVNEMMVRMFLNGPNDPKHVFLLSYEELNLLVIVFILGALVWKNLKKQMEWKSSFLLNFFFFLSSSSSVVGPDDRYDFSEVISGP